MKKLSAIIIDDEKGVRELLLELIERHCPEVTIIGVAVDVESAFKEINTKKPDIIFLDVQMPKGDGFSLLRKFSKPPFEVIFVTSYDQYAISAIKFSALDYLLKPVDVKDLIEAVKKAIKKRDDRNDNEQQIINLLNNADERNPEKKIAVHQNEKVKFVKISEVHYIEADDRYSHIYMSATDKYTLTKTLKDFEEFLRNHPLLIRINKSHMINLNHVSNYSKGEPCIIEMTNGKAFEISRRKKQEVLEALRLREKK